MPMKSCASPGCRTLVPVGTVRCQAHARAAAKDRWARADAARAAKPSRRWYGLKRWRNKKTGLKIRVLQRDGWRCQWPGCGCLLREGRSDPQSAVVDHIMPHREDPELFWNEANLWSLCKTHHDIHKARKEAGLR